MNDILSSNFSMRHQLGGTEQPSNRCKLNAHFQIPSMYKAGSVAFLSFCFEPMNHFTFCLQLLEAEDKLKRTHSSFIH